MQEQTQKTLKPIHTFALPRQWHAIAMHCEYMKQKTETLEALKAPSLLSGA